MGERRGTGRLPDVTRRIVVAISGASGAVYGVRLLEVLAADPTIETHAIISRGAAATIDYEMGRPIDEVAGLADVVHAETDLAATLASGTYLTDGMVVAPCSIRTLSSIANSNNDNLITRAADVHLKERRPLILMVRETPFHLGHLRLMSDVTAAGAIILPPIPGFYIRPTTIDDIVDHSVGKALDSLHIEHGLFERWPGIERAEVRDRD
jgi:4-hydroxy-3-polyprenylbenzoate decarboxylase